MTGLDGLDSSCAACGRVAGDHTLREWAGCIGAVTTHLPYEATPADMAGTIATDVRERFGLDGDLIVADHVTVRALVLGGASGTVGIRAPLLLHEFQLGLPDQPPVTVVRVGFVGNVDSVRGYGRLVRDGANGAANAAER